MTAPVTYYAICDADAFYVACERVFDPSLRGRPVVVLSNNDGCCIARSAEARALGIEMGTPYFTIRERCGPRGIAALSSNYTLYGDMSRRLAGVLAAHAHDVEPYSIDECFLELKFRGQTPETLTRWAEGVRAEVLRLTGVPTTIGIARTKTLAKLASHLAKRVEGGAPARYLDAGDPALDGVPLGKVWGCGRAYVRRLGEVGVTTAAGLRDVSEEYMRRQFGVVGQRIAREARGLPSLSFATAPPPRKRVMVSRSFPEDIACPAELRRRLALYASRLGDKLRALGKQAAALCVYVWFNPHKLPAGAARGYRRAVALPVPTDADAHLVAWSRFALGTQLEPGRSYKKVGVEATELVDASASQTSLWGSTERHTRARHAQAAADALNRRFGRGTVYVAACGESPAVLPMRCELLSPRYTTRPGDIPEALAC